MWGDIFISCACLTERDWTAWCPCLIITHKHLCALSVLVCVFRRKPWENLFILATEQCVCDHHSIFRRSFPTEAYTNTCYYQWLKFIPASCNWSILWNAYGVMTLFYTLMFFRLKCEFWRLRLYRVRFQRMLKYSFKWRYLNLAISSIIKHDFSDTEITFYIWKWEKQIYFEGKAFEVKRMNQERFICGGKKSNYGKGNSPPILFVDLQRYSSRLVSVAKGLINHGEWFYIFCIEMDEYEA